jgi:hypothetical protein
MKKICDSKPLDVIANRSAARLLEPKRSCVDRSKARLLLPAWSRPDFHVAASATPLAADCTGMGLVLFRPSRFSAPIFEGELAEFSAQKNINKFFLSPFFVF